MEFRVPELGEGVHEGEFVKWLVRPGEVVEHDRPLCEIMTDKATVEIPASFDGKVTELRAKEGQTVKVNEVLLSFEPGAIASPAGPAGQEPEQPAELSGQTGGEAFEKEAAARAVPLRRADHIAAAPATRRLAREMGIELSAVSGSGPNGRILYEDVERAASGGRSSSRTVPSETFRRKLSVAGPAVPGAEPGPSTPEVQERARSPEERVPFAGLRRKISEKMRLSKDHAAHFTYIEEADATELVRLRMLAKDIGEKQGVKVTYLPFVMKSMVEALRQFPILNSTLDEEKGELVYKHYFNIGISIQTAEGLTAPVIRDVEHKSILTLARELQDLASRAKSKQLHINDFHGGTITITNVGSIGGLFATPVINYPEVAILGFNKIFRQPVVRKSEGREEVVIRDRTYFSLSLDHRVVDGAIGAEFMKLFVRYIENPSLLLVS